MKRGNLTIIAGTYALDPAHTSIGFVARHAMITKVRGNFTEFEGTLTVGENINESAATATVKTASIDTNNADRDAHVKNEDFFDVEKCPEMTFTATTFDVNEQGEGTTKSVNFKVEEAGVAEDPFGNTRLGFEAKTSINRTDFGIDFNAPLKTGGVLVSEEIKIELEVSAIKQ